MKSINQWFDEYAESHQHPTNKMVHWICVPVIVFSIIGLFTAIPFPQTNSPGFFKNWAFVIYVLSMLFYWRLSLSIFRGLAVVFAVFLWLNYWLLIQGLPLWQISLTLFVLAWLGQFWGHRIEGKKPSFLKDLQFLLIGPAWLLHFIYKKNNISF